MSAATPKPLAARQSLKADAILAFWPEQSVFPAEVQAFASDHNLADTLAEADFLSVNVPDRASALEFFDNHLDALGDVAAIWLIYPKGNRTDINRDSLWQLLLGYGWRPVSNISVDDTHSSIRIRPLKPGETGLHK